jgi:hypothetical protein
MTHLRRAILAAALFCGAATTAGLAAGQEISFKDKRINVIIGSSPGGGTDATTRHLGRFLERHLPGNPQMVYRNIPAGQGVKATNYFANEARRDGTAWMGGASNYISASTLRKSVVEYDPTRFAFVGGINRGGSLLIMRKSKLADLADKSKPPMVAGTTDGSPSWTMMVLWGTDVLGWNVKFVVGYPGTSALLLAARRGEIDSFGTSNLAMLKTLQTSGEFVGMAQDGQLEGGKFVPRSDLGATCPPSRPWSRAGSRAWPRRLSTSGTRPTRSTSGTPCRRRRPRPSSPPTARPSPSPPATRISPGPARLCSARTSPCSRART